MAGASVRAYASLTPRTHFFGDTVVARIDVTVDRGRIAADAVRVDSVFTPYRPVGQPRWRRSSAAGLTHLRYTVRLRCLTNACLVPDGRAQLRFPPATISYLDRDSNRRSSIRVAWPSSEVVSRLDDDDRAADGPHDTPLWRANLSSLPPVSYRVRPGIAQAGLVGVAVGLLLAAGVLVFRLLSHNEPTSPLRPALAHPPLPTSTPSPLERALMRLEGLSGHDNSIVERRSALEALALELDREGEVDLARRARELAWSSAPPRIEASRTLAAGVRQTTEARR